MIKNLHTLFELSVRIVAVFVAILGTVVILGWHLHAPALIQILPHLAPMQYNTALCFILTAAALFTASHHYHLAARIFAALASLFGIFTLSQHLFHFDLGIDELLFKHYIFTKTAFPGRMSAATALTFSICGLAIFTASFRTHRKIGRLGIVGPLGLLAATLGTISVAGYAVGLAGTPGWSTLTQMALHTSLGAIFLGSGIVALAWIREVPITGRSPDWLPAGALLSGLLGTLILWSALKEVDHKNTESAISAIADSVQLEVIARLDSRKKALERMAGRWEAAQFPDRTEWEQDAQSYYEDFAGYRAIAWVDSETRVRWLYPLETNQNVVGKVLANEPRRKATFEKARREDKASFSQPVTLINGGLGILLPEPLAYDNRFDGYIVGAIELSTLFDAIIPAGLINGYSIKISQAGELLYSRPANFQKKAQAHRESRMMRKYGASWLIEVTPLPITAKQLQSSYPTAVLIAGIFFSGLLSFTVRLTQAAGRRSSKLSAANKDLQTALADLDEAQHQLAETSRRAGMAEVATNVLHNVGNVLNSVNVSCSVLLERAGGKRIASLRKAGILLEENSTSPDFINTSPIGQKLPSFLSCLASRMEHERLDMVSELKLLSENIDHIKSIVAMQQTYAMATGSREKIHATELIEDSIRMNGNSYIRHNVSIVKNYKIVPNAIGEKHKVLQILVNLISNAKHACAGTNSESSSVIIDLTHNKKFVIIGITDDGVGIPPENITKVFANGFTTKPNGHGFGLHSSAISAAEMGGRLTASSPGLGKGATFTLRLPVA